MAKERHYEHNSKGLDVSTSAYKYHYLLGKHNVGALGKLWLPTHLVHKKSVYKVKWLDIFINIFQTFSITQYFYLQD
jgi:hypothetical protein